MAQPIVAESDIRHDSPSADKVALFRSPFRGREDVYPVRWQSKGGRSGYSPACGNEWVPGVCEKPRIKCSDCPNRAFLSVSDEAIYEHLAGRHTLGVYPLSRDDTTWFVAADFDGDGWREDARAFVAACRQLEIPAYLEISRSGDGAHVWIFFEFPVAATKARQLASAAITGACARHHLGPVLPGPGTRVGRDREPTAARRPCRLLAADHPLATGDRFPPGKFIRFLTVEPDHDSTYGKK